MLYVDPQDCIDCDLCRPECPVEAIFADDAIPDEYEPFIALNEEMAARSPVISEQKEPLAG